MPIYNLTEYSKNYSKTSKNLQNYYRDKPNSSVVDNVSYFIKYSKSFDYKAAITGKLGGMDETKNVKVVVPLKYLRIFWRALELLWLVVKCFNFGMVWKLCSNKQSIMTG